MTTSAAKEADFNRGVALTWVICAPEFAEHAVTDDAFALGRTVGRGLYEALCGRLVAPASMLSEPLSRCPVCTRVLFARTTLGTVEERLNGRAGCRRVGPLGRAVRRWFGHER